MLPTEAFTRRFGIDGFLKHAGEHRQEISRHAKENKKGNKSKSSCGDASLPKVKKAIDWFGGVRSPEPVPPTPPHSEFKSAPLWTPNSASSKRGRHGATPIVRQQPLSERHVHFSQLTQTHFDGETQIDNFGETQIHEENDTVVNDDSTLIEESLLTEVLGTPRNGDIASNSLSSLCGLDEDSDSDDAASNASDLSDIDIATESFDELLTQPNQFCSKNSRPEMSRTTG
jgi:hypothetical protein